MLENHHCEQEKEDHGHEAIDRWVHEDLEIEEYNYKVKIDQVKKWLHVDTLMLNEEVFQTQAMTRSQLLSGRKKK